MAQPVVFGAGREKACIDWLDSELRQAIADRQSLEAKWIQWLEQYRAPADQPVKNFPYDGASNAVLPITAIDVDQLYAGFLTTIHEPQNLWTLAPKNERWIHAAKPTQDFLQFLDQSIVNMYGVNKRLLLEMTKLGTGIYKTGWDYTKRNVWTYDENGQRQRVKRTRSVPFVDHVRCYDFIMPSYSYAIQAEEQGGAPWVAERTRKNVDVLRALADATDPALPNIPKDKLDKVLAYETRGLNNYDQAIRQQDYDKRASAAGTSDTAFETNGSAIPSISSTGTLLPREIELYEIHARFATQGDTFDDIVLWYHLPTYTILRAVYLPFDHGMRPYEAVRYFPGEGFWGIGVCEQSEFFQKERSDLWNYQHDNVLLSNSVMLAVSEDSNIVPGESIFPGKVFRLSGDDVRKGLMPIQMSQINQTLPQLHEMIASLGRDRTAVSEIARGSLENLPGRTPATSLLAAQSEGKKRPDLTLKDMRYGGMSKVGLRLLQLSQQFMRRQDLSGPHLMTVATDMLGEPEGSVFRQMLSMPNENPELGLGVSLTATSAVANKEVAKQNLMALLQLAGGLGPQMVQMAQVLMQAKAQQDPITADIAIKSITAISQLYTQLLEQSDVRNAEQLVPEVSPQAAGSGPQGGQGIPDGTGGIGGGGAQGLVGASGLGALSVRPGAPV